MELLVDVVFVIQVVVLVGLLAARLPLAATAAVVGWLAFTGALAWAGALLRAGTIPLYFPLLVLTPILAGIFFLRSTPGEAVLSALPPASPVVMQSFRIVMEVVLWALAEQGRVPYLITFEGRNVDILIGLTAWPVAWYCFVRRTWPVRVAVLWNVAGLIILANVVFRAYLSAPTPLRIFFTQPPTGFIGTMPYVWLPTFLVPLAVWLHTASLMRQQPAYPFRQRGKARARAGNP
jgi:hypothetical protein